MNTSNEIRRLYKSRTNRMIDGVCGGVAEYFGFDPTLVRIAWVLLIFPGGLGIILYIAGMILMPKNPAIIMPTGSVPNTVSSASSHTFWGILLVVIGMFWLMSNLGVWHHWWGLSWEFFLPVVLILAGVGFLFGGRNYVTNQQAAPSPGSQGDLSGATGPAPVLPVTPARLYRSRLERKLFGVCGGLGAHFAVDPTIVRVLFVISAFASFGLTIFAYILMAIIVPDEPLTFPA